MTNINLQKNANDHINQIPIQIKADKTKLLSLGPAKLELFITSMNP